MLTDATLLVLLRCRYHAKRALYLAHIMQALQSEPAVSKVTLGTLCNDPRYVTFACTRLQ